MLASGPEVGQDRGRDVGETTHSLCKSVPVVSNLCAERTQEITWHITMISKNAMLGQLQHTITRHVSSKGYTYLQYSPDVHEPQCSEFQPYVIIHF